MTTYLLTCGHTADVPGPHGATTGRAWCDTCHESAAVATETPDLLEVLRRLLPGNARARQNLRAVMARTEDQ